MLFIRTIEKNALKAFQELARLSIPGLAEENARQPPACTGQPWEVLPSFPPHHVLEFAEAVVQRDPDIGQADFCTRA